MKHTALLTIALCTCTLLLNAQTDTTATADDELEQWLQLYATPVTTGTIPPDSSTAHPDTATPADTLRAENGVPAPADSIKTTGNGKKQIDATIISEAFSKSKSLHSQKGSTGKSKITTVTEKAGQKPQKKGSTSKTDKTPRPVIPDIPSGKAVLLSAGDSAAIKNNALTGTTTNPMFMDWVMGLPPYSSKTLSNSDSTVTATRNGARKAISITKPELYDYHVSQLPESTELNSRKLKNADADKLALQSDKLKVKKNTTINIDLPDLPKWKAGARFQLQASQNYISPNWYKGGESNLAGQLYAMGYCNYNNRSNLQWDNKIEWKLGVNSTISDTLRMVGVNEDLFRINSKLGMKAFKSFFYTAEFDFQTSLFNAYKPQTYIRTSAPFSPVRTNLSLGIDYKFREKLSVFVSPLSYKLIYVADTTRHASVRDDETIACLNGITDGSRMLNQLGALLRIGWAHQFNNSIEMEVKFSFFGNYVGQRKGIETDLEVIGNFLINRFFSAKVSLNPRFDSTVATADGQKPKLQFRELVSVGFNYVL